MAEYTFAGSFPASPSTGDTLLMNGVTYIYSSNGMWQVQTPITFETNLEVADGKLSQNNFTDDDHSKLDAIEANATADQSKSDIEALGIAASSITGALPAIDGSNLTGLIANMVEDTTPQLGGNLDTQTFTVDGRDVGTDGTKLDTVETSATADQTGAEIKSAYEGESDTNAFTDADHSKLDGIETSATADQTGAEIKSAYEGESNTNAFTDADHSKLDGIASSANNYSHPTGNGNNHIPSNGSTDQVLTYSSAGTATWADASGGGAGGMEIYDSSGTHTWNWANSGSPDYVYVTCVGAGASPCTSREGGWGGVFWNRKIATTGNVTVTVGDGSGGYIHPDYYYSGPAGGYSQFGSSSHRANGGAASYCGGGPYTGSDGSVTGSGGISGTAKTPAFNYNRGSGQGQDGVVIVKW